MNIKSILCSLAITSVALTQVSADTVTIDQNTSIYSVGSGGAFKATPVSGTISNADYASVATQGGISFLTFCLEENEFFSPGSTYSYALNYGAVNGGVSGQDATNYDSVSNATAYLYSEFAKGTLGNGFTYDLNALTGYGALQQAIWFLEGEVFTSNSFVSYAQGMTGWSWNAASNGSYGVYALNLRDSRGGVAQDQLYYSTNAHVPDGGMTLALLGLGLLGLAIAKRRA